MALIGIRRSLIRPKKVIVTGGGGGSPSIFVTDSFAHYNASAANWTHSFGVGSATSSDLIFIFLEDDTPSTRTVSIGGFTATPVSASVDNETSIYQATGCTISGGVVSVTVTEVSVGAFAASVGYVHGNASNTPTSAPTPINYSFFMSPDVSLAGCVVPANGVGVAFWGEISGGTLPATWTGFTRQSAGETSQPGTPGNATGCSAATQSTPGTYTATVTNNTNGVIAFAAWA